MHAKPGRSLSLDESVPRVSGEWPQRCPSWSRHPRPALLLWANVCVTAVHDRVMAALVDVPIRDESIRLGQFLKLANLLDSGAEAKAYISDGLVQVDGEVELRRGRQLRGGEVVSVPGAAARVVTPLGGHCERS